MNHTLIFKYAKTWNKEYQKSDFHNSSASYAPSWETFTMQSKTHMQITPAPTPMILPVLASMGHLLLLSRQPH